MVLIDNAGAGDIISMAGLASPSIGHTVANVEVCELFLSRFHCKVSSLYNLFSDARELRFSTPQYRGH